MAPFSYMLMYLTVQMLGEFDCVAVMWQSGFRTIADACWASHGALFGAAVVLDHFWRMQRWNPYDIDCDYKIF